MGDTKATQSPVRPADVAPARAFIEIFCGTGRLADAFARRGFVAVGIDHVHGRHVPLSPRVRLDLSLPSSVQLVTETLRCDHTVTFIWVSPPAGSLSRAREIEVKGGGPRPLRSCQHPLGLPDLGTDDRIRVARENSLASNVAQIIQACAMVNVHWAVQHPWRSYLWDLPDFRALAHAAHSAIFPACAFGGSTGRKTRILTSLPPLAAKMSRQCTRDHLHRDWLQRWSPSARAAHRPKDEAFSPAFCTAVADICSQFTSLRAGPLADGPNMASLVAASSAPPVKAALKTRAAAGLQPRSGYAPLISQFRHTIKLSSSLDEADRLKALGILSAHDFCGGVRLPPGSRVTQVLSSPGGNAGPSSSPIAEIHVGMPWSPSQFI